MTEKMRQFMEIISADTELKERATKAETKEELADIAMEAGVTLGEEDFAEQTQDSELTEEDLENVVGGVNCCTCILSGGGADEEPCECSLLGTGNEDKSCTCFVAGQGIDG